MLAGIIVSVLVSLDVILFVSAYRANVHTSRERGGVAELHG